MAILSKTGSFTLTNADSDPVTISGVGFTPKVIIIFSVEASAIPTNAIIHIEQIIGAAASASQENCTYQLSENNQADSNTDRIGYNGCIVGGFTSACNVQFAYTLNSFTSDGFVLNIITKTPATRVFSYLALGGDELTNAAVAEIQTGTATGSLTKTGLGFQGNSIILIGSMPDFSSTCADDAKHSMGIADANGNQYCCAYQDEDNEATTKCDRRSCESLIGMELDSAGNLDGQMAFTSFDSDGFTLTRTQAFSANRYFYAIVLKTARARAGKFQLQTGTGNFSVSGIDQKPEALICMTTQQAAPGISAGDVAFGLGVSGGSAGHCIAVMSQDNAGTSDTNRAHRDDALIRTYDPSSHAQLSSLELVSFDADGFTMDQSDASPSADNVYYLALGQKVHPWFYKTGFSRQ